LAEDVDGEDVAVTAAVLLQQAAGVAQEGDGVPEHREPRGGRDRHH
jgi:hypothetical protein